MLENKYVEQYDCHYSRFIASWYNVGGRNVSCMFKRWLKENFPLLTEQDINAMANMMTCGKLEMEVNARAFLKDYTCDFENCGIL